MCVSQSRVTFPAPLAERQSPVISSGGFRRAELGGTKCRAERDAPSQGKKKKKRKEAAGTYIYILSCNVVKNVF